MWDGTAVRKEGSLRGLLPALIFGVDINELQLLVAKPPTRLFMRERKPVPGRSSLAGKDSLEAVCPPLYLV